nr:gustatory receptor 13 [Podabrus annulatus]
MSIVVFIRKFNKPCKMRSIKNMVVSKFESKENFKNYTFHKLTEKYLLVARCFAAFPVYGITKNVKDLNFKWKSFLVLYSLLSIAIKMFYTIIVLMFSKLDIKEIFSMVFILWDVRAISEFILFIKVAYKWPKLVQKLSNIEKRMIRYGPVKNLRAKFITWPLIFLITGLGEHILHRSVKTYQILKNVEQGDDLMEKYFLGMFVHFFYGVQYAPWKGFLMEFQSWISTFAWQFNDLLIVLLSIAVAERFKQLSSKIGSDKKFDALEWEEIRKTYTQLTHFCKMLNEIIYEMLAISMVGNICYVSVYIFQAFKQRTQFEAIYFWYNMMFVLLHFFIVCLCTAQVNEESVEPLKHIFNIKSEYMYYEVWA